MEEVQTPDVHRAGEAGVECAAGPASIPLSVAVGAEPRA